MLPQTSQQSSVSNMLQKCRENIKHMHLSSSLLICLLTFLSLSLDLWKVGVVQRTWQHAKRQWQRLEKRKRTNILYQRGENWRMGVWTQKVRACVWAGRKDLSTPPVSCQTIGRTPLAPSTHCPPPPPVCQQSQRRKSKQLASPSLQCWGGGL